MTRVFLHHMKVASLEYCNRGGRLFFARHGLSWANFLREGIDAEELIKTGDAQALRVVDVARQEALRNGR